MERYPHDLVIGRVRGDGLLNQQLFVIEKTKNTTQNKVIELLGAGICFPLKSEYDRVNYTLEGIRQSSPPSVLDTPAREEATVHAIPHGDWWNQVGRH